MGWAAVDNKHQVYENQPKKAFEKAQTVYGKWMKNAPKNDHYPITTDFDALLAIRKARAARVYRWNNIRFFLTAISISAFLIVFLIMTLLRIV